MLLATACSKSEVWNRYTIDRFAVDFSIEAPVPPKIKFDQPNEGLAIPFQDPYAAIVIETEDAEIEITCMLQRDLPGSFVPSPCSDFVNADALALDEIVDLNGKSGRLVSIAMPKGGEYVSICIEGTHFFHAKAKTKVDIALVKRILRSIRIL